MKANRGFSAIALMTLICTSAFTFAQDIDVTDTLCSETDNICDPGYGDCVTTTSAFYVPATGDYTFSVSLISCFDATVCGKCLACGTIIDTNTGATTYALHTTCEPNEREVSTENCHLTAGVPYRIRVCLRTCPGYTCESCRCYARAKLHIS